MKKMFGVKKHITESSYEDIKDLPVISGNLVTESPTQHICTLQRYLHVVADSDKYAFIEIKQDLDVGFLNEIISVVNSYDMYERTFFISSEAKTLLRLRYDLSFPKERLQYVHGAKARDSHVPVNEALITRLVAHGIGLDARHSLLDEKFVDELHDVGQSVNVWTVDTEKDCKKVVEKYGVDMVTMNDVRAMV
jgi:glycerophosphoryl diester phosphodiesterase